MAAKHERSHAQKREDSRRLNKAIAKAIAGIQPPENLTVTEWAEKHRRLSAESSAEPGPWRTERTPYLRGPMDAFTDPKVDHIVVWAASQVGKSEFINNAIGYIPRPWFNTVYPTDNGRCKRLLQVTNCTHDTGQPDA